MYTAVRVVHEATPLLLAKVMLWQSMPKQLWLVLQQCCPPKFAHLNLQRSISSNGVLQLLVHLPVEAALPPPPPKPHLPQPLASLQSNSSGVGTYMRRQEMQTSHSQHN